MKGLILVTLLAATMASASTPNSFLNCDLPNACPANLLSEVTTKGISLLGTCTPAQATLATALTAAVKTGNQVALDSAFKTFCEGDCFKGASAFNATHDCCLAKLNYHLPFAGLRNACQMSTQNSGRRCGAELPMLVTIGACAAATDATSCAAVPTGMCEWAGGMCHFKPSAPALQALCTPCTRSYFKNFPSGGFFGAAEFPPMVSLFEYACTKIEDTFCLLEMHNNSYGLAGAPSTPEQAGATCSTRRSVTRRCQRALANTASRALIRTAQNALNKCNKTAPECATEFGQSLAVAQALPVAAAESCRGDSNGPCLSPNRDYFSQPCIRQAGAGQCSGNCSAMLANYFAQTQPAGCCARYFGKSATLILSQASPRALLANIMASGVTGAPPPPGSNFTTTLMGAADKVAANFLGNIPQVCSGVNGSSGVNASLVAAFMGSATAASCDANLPTRTYAFTVGANYGGYDACADKALVKLALEADIAMAVGFSTAQIVSTTISAVSSTDNNTVVTIRIRSDTPDDFSSMDADVANSRADIYLLGTSRDILAKCPAMLPYNVLTPMALSMRIVTDNAADATTNAAAVVTTTQQATQPTVASTTAGSTAAPTTAPRPSVPSAASGVGAMAAGAVVAALSALLMAF